MFLKWDDALSIDHGDIDKDHKDFMALLDDILCCTSDDDIMISASDLIGTCSEYIRNHLAREDKLMISMKYPSASKHIGEHVSVLTQLKNISDGAKNNEVNIKYKLFTWVISYAHRHINVHDKRLAEYCRAM